MCAIQRVNDKTKHLGAFERGMVVGARRTGLCQELQHCWVFHAKQFPLCIKNGLPPKGPPANLTQLWEALESTWANIPVGREVQVTIRKVFLMFDITSYTSCT